MTNVIEMLDKFSSVNSVPSVLKNSPPEPLSADQLAETLEHLELQTEHADAMAQHSPNVFLKAALNIAAVDFYTVLNRFETDTLSKRLEEKPELYFQMMNSFARFLEANLEREKFEFKKEQADAKRREREQKLRARKPILLTLPTLRAFSNLVASAPDAETRVLRPEPRTPDVERPTTANTGLTDCLEFAADNVSKAPTDSGPTLEHCEPRTVDHESIVEPAWSDAPTEELIACPS